MILASIRANPSDHLCSPDLFEVPTVRWRKRLFGFTAETLSRGEHIKFRLSESMQNQIQEAQQTQKGWITQRSQRTQSSEMLSNLFGSAETTRLRSSTQRKKGDDRDRKHKKGCCDQAPHKQVSALSEFFNPGFTISRLHFSFDAQIVCSYPSMHGVREF